MDEFKRRNEITRKKYFKRLKIFLKERVLFFSRNSTLHGLGHITTSRSILSRVLWVSVVAASTGCAALLLAPAAGGHPHVSYTLDTRYLPWATTFPAVTVCEKYYSSHAQKKFIKYAPGLLDPLNLNYRKYLTDLLYGVGTCTQEVCAPCGAAVACDVPWRLYIDQMHKKCEELIAECRFGGAAFSCCDRFRAVDSQHGACYSFNTLQHSNSSQDALSMVNISTGPGLLSFRLQSDASISIHSPEELPTNHLDNKLKKDVLVRKTNWVEILFSVVEMANDPLLKFEDISVRGCRYLHEATNHPLHVYPVYAYGACKLAQNTEDSFDQCGCIHPARTLAYQNMYCNYSGLNCLVHFEASKVKLGIHKQANHVECLPSCVESELTIIHYSEKWVLHDDGEGTLVNVRMSSIPTLRYEKNLLKTKLDAVVSVGGTLGLLFGASILSLAEMLYLIFREPN